MIVFRNPGLIDLVAATTFGVNAKDSSNPIGQFGTGLKYAIAATLRAGGRFTLYRGTNRYVVRAVPTEVRGQAFDVVHLEASPLGFTTHLGAHWEPWQVYRELYCNALDEGGEVFLGRVQPHAGETVITIEGWPELELAHEERERIVLPAGRRRAAVVPGELEILPQDGEDPWVYNRGVRAGQLEKPTAGWTYNFPGGLALTEDRTFRNPYSVNASIVRGIMQLEDEDLLVRILRAPRDSFEGGVSYAAYGGTPTEAFLRVVEREHVDFTRPFNHSAVDLLKEARGAAWGLRTVELNAVEERAVEEARGLLAAMGYEVPRGSLEFVATLGPSTLGLCVREPARRIFISRRAFDVGLKCLAGTILEEHLHAEHGFDDCTRDLQNYLLDRLVHIGALHHAGRVL